MAVDYSDFPISKGEPRVARKARAKRLDAKNERAAREITRKRDKGKCVVPGCKDSAQHLHHIVYRSHSKQLRWATSNLCWLCRRCHQLLHLGKISISGNADDELVMTGDINALRFRL